MGDGVFGIPVTDRTLRKLRCYKGNANLNATDRAQEALKLKNSEGKHERAFKYLLDLKKSCGYKVGTFCLVYNATGDTLKYALRKDWAGHIGCSPYPIQIANGQWGAFLHVEGQTNKSIGAVVYHGKDAKAADCDWLVAWNNAWIERNKNLSTSAYNEVRDRGHFLKPDWTAIQDKMQKASVYYSDDKVADHRKGTSSFAAIGYDDFPIFTAILTLKDA